MVVHETSMPAEYEALRNYFRNKFPECRIRVMYEAGFRGFNLYDNLVADGWECVVTPPHTVTEEKCNKQKNDTYDCRRLAKNNENGDYRTCHVPDKQLREDRQVSRLCGQVQKDITRVSNRIRREIEYHGLERQFPMGPWSSGTYRQARETVKGLAISEELRFTFEMHFRELEILRSMKLKALRRLRQIGDSQRYKRTVELLESAPGIGRLTATRLALEWGDLQRFKTKEGFASFLGLIPSDYSSGEADHKGHITKQGNRQVRAWLIESTWIAIRKDPVLLEKYRAVLSHSGSGKKAIVATARKFAMRLRAVVLRGEPYEIGLIECEHGVKSGETESCDKVEQKVAA